MLLRVLHGIEDSREHSHVSLPILDQLRLYLGKVNGTLSLHPAWKPALPRQGDAFLMELFLDMGLTAKELAIVNNVRMYLQVIFLQVIFLSDIYNIVLFLDCSKASSKTGRIAVQPSVLQAEIDNTKRTR